MRLDNYCNIKKYLKKNYVFNKILKMFFKILKNTCNVFWKCIVKTVFLLKPFFLNEKKIKTLRNRNLNLYQNFEKTREKQSCFLVLLSRWTHKLKSFRQEIKCPNWRNFLSWNHFLAYGQTIEYFGVAKICHVIKGKTLNQVPYILDQRTKFI